MIEAFPHSADASSSPPSGLADNVSDWRHYQAFGLNIVSELALAELEPGDRDRPGDILIRRHPLRYLPRLERAGYQHLFGKRVQYLTWPNVGGFRITQGTTIDIDLLADTPRALVNLPLLGPVIATALHARGMLILHASGVLIDGKPILFLGDKGAGKSTTAAALVGAGHPLFTDDIMPVSVTADGKVTLHSGYPQLKLVEDASQSLALADGYLMPRPIPEFPKQQHRLAQCFRHADVAPHKIFILQRSDRFAAERLSSSAAFAGLMRFCYMTLLRPQWNEPERIRLLRQIAALTNAAQVSILNVPSELQELSGLASFIETEAAR